MKEDFRVRSGIVRWPMLTRPKPIENRRSEPDAAPPSPWENLRAPRGFLQREGGAPELGVRRRKAGWKPALRFGCGFADLSSSVLSVSSVVLLREVSL